MLHHSFSKTVNTPRKFPSRVQQNRQRSVDNNNDEQRPKPAAHAAPGIMPNGGSNDARERHRQHELPSDIHHLIHSNARERGPKPKVNEKQATYFCEKPNVRRKKFEHTCWRMPAAEK